MRIFQYLIVLIALIISSTSFAGTLVINSNQSDPAAKESFMGYVAAFEKAHPEVTVKVNHFDHEEYKVAIRNFLTAEAPDVALWFAGNRMKFFVDQGLFEDVSDLWEGAGSLSETHGSTKSSLTVDGKQYGAAYAYYQIGVYYRKDIFEKLGINEPKTWDEFLWVCAMLKNNDVEPIAIGTKYLWTAAAWFDYLNIRINGIDFHMRLMAGQESYEDMRLDDVFDHWKELVEPGYFLKDHQTYSWQDAIAPMNNGDAAMYLIGNFIVPFFDDGGSVDNIGFFQFPMIKDGIGVFEDAPTDTIHIPSGAKNKEDARKFLRFLQNPEAAYNWASNNGVLSTNKNSQAPTDRFQQEGFSMLSAADGLAQFYDRDTNPDMAAAGMEGMQEFMVKPDREAKIRARMDKERKRIFSN